VAKHAVTNRYLAINGTAISDHCSAIEISDTADDVEVTSFSGSGYKEFVPAMKDAEITASIFADFAAASVNAMLQPLYQSGGTFSVEVRDDQSAVSATNPKATMTARLYQYAPISGAVGDAVSFDVTFRNAGTAGLVWGTT
jgi:hypothetical protein